METSKSDVAWLIEKPQHARPGSPPIYWGYEEGSEGWTCDINEAIRFDTRDLADMRGSDCGILEYEVVEHAWIGSKLPEWKVSMQITSRISHASVKVYINDILHIHFPREKFLGLQSWQFEDETMFYIELTLEGGVIKCDYDRRDMWLGILAELAKAR